VDPAGVETVYYAPQGEILGFKRGTETYQVHADALGSVRIVTNASGAGVAIYEFLGSGEELSQSGALASELTCRFVGSFGVKTLNGLAYMRHRWYDSALGQFLSRDPEDDADNTYQYAGGNPVRYVDPDGLKFVLDDRTLPREQRLSEEERKMVQGWLNYLQSSQSPIAGRIKAMARSPHPFRIGKKDLRASGKTEPDLRRGPKRELTFHGAMIWLDFQEMKTKKEQEKCGGKLVAILAHELGHAHTMMEHPMFAAIMNRARLRWIDTGDLNLEYNGYPFDEAYTVAKYEDPVKVALGVAPSFNAADVAAIIRKMKIVGIPVP
jgi:RHS repeat-associated protein